MDISGKIIAILAQQTGEGRNGSWRSQDFVLETKEQYPKKICFNLFGSKIEQFPIALQDEVKISFDIESREWNGRWFTTIRAWKVEKLQNTEHSIDEIPPYFDHAPLPKEIPGSSTSSTEPDNDLPF